MKKGSPFWIMLLLMVWGLNLAPLTSKGEMEKKGRLKPIKLANPGTGLSSFLPFEMGEKKGFYRKEGIDLDILLMKPNIAIAGLMGGQIDFVGALGTPIRAAVVKVPIRVIFVVTDTLPQVLIAKPSIKKVSDLKGKTLGISSLGSSEHFAAKEIVRAAHLDPDKDLNIVPLGHGMHLSALFAGSVDSAFLVSPRNFLAMRRGFHQLIRVADVIKIPSIGLATNLKRINEDRNTVKMIIKATIKSMMYIKEHRDDTVDYMMKSWQYENFDREMAIATYEAELDNYTKDGTVPDSVIQREIETAKKEGIIKGDVPLKEVVDFSFAREVKAELGIK